MNDNERRSNPPLGSAGGRHAEAPVYGEPNGPRPPIMTTVDKPAHEIEARPKVASPFASNSPTERPPAHHATRDDVAIHGFHGGVEHSQEMKAVRKVEAPEE